MREVKNYNETKQNLYKYFSRVEILGETIHVQFACPGSVFFDIYIITISLVNCRLELFF